MTLRAPVETPARVLPAFMAVQRHNALWTAHRVSEPTHSLPLARAREAFELAGDRSLACKVQLTFGTEDTP